MIQRGKNDKIVVLNSLVLPLEVKFCSVKLTISSIFVLGIGIVLLLGYISGGNPAFGILCLTVFMLILGIMMVIICIKSYGKVILKIDDVGITYHPLTLAKQRHICPVLWSDITSIDEKVISYGRGCQSDQQVDVMNPEIYLIKSSGKLFDKLTRFINKPFSVENTVILAPLSLLKIKTSLLLVTCHDAYRKHEIRQTNKEIAMKQEAERVKPMAESKAGVAPTIEQISSSPFDIENEPGKRQRTKKLANFLTLTFLLIFLMVAGFSFFKSQTKYAGLKNKTQYFVTKSETKTP